MYRAKFTSGGSAVCQIERSENTPVCVKANIPGMDPKVVSVINPRYDAGAIFDIEVPAGLEVTIESGSEVSSAKLFTE